MLVVTAIPVSLGWLPCQRNPRPSTGLTTRLLLLKLAWWMSFRRRSVSLPARYCSSWNSKWGASLVLRGKHQNWKRRLLLASRCPSFTSCRAVLLTLRRVLWCHLPGGNLWHCTVRKLVKENLIIYFGCRSEFG